ncbi:MAG: hypothetical protein JSS02_00285 [Planctomycetes bacterium]|nr:hypothetical protein [Planctomycetota bacterium]
MARHRLFKLLLLLLTLSGISLGCTVWPPELPPAISNRPQVPETDSSQPGDEPATTPNGKPKPRDEFLYIE